MSSARRHIGPLLHFIILFLFFTADSLSPAQHTVAANPKTAYRKTLKAATLNMYVGFDLSPFVDGSVTTSEPSEIKSVLDELYAIYVGNLPKERIKAMAAAIVKADPDIIGLQEGFLLSVDGFELADYLEELTEAIIDAGGPEYRVAALDSMTFDGKVDLGAFAMAIGFRDRDSVLYKKELDCRPLDQGKVYASARKPAEILGKSYTLSRGVLGLRCTAENDRAFYFYNTHLDVAGQGPVQEAQAKELLSYVRATATEANLPVIIAGDFNAHDDGQFTRTYSLLTENGFADSYRAAHPDSAANPGHTCCQKENLSNQFSLAHKRIDYIFQSGAKLPVGQSRVFSNEWFPRSDAKGLIWPSDHFGVWTEFKWDSR